MSHVPPTLRRGSKGEAVKGLQNVLRQRGHHVEIDGDFGFTTESTVRQFQQHAGLVEDGIVGPNTWGALSVHVVQSGETLFKIAEAFLGDGNRWPEIFDLNRDIVADPDRIMPDQVLALPITAF
jgi:peptidoglycan hydrolase-like protein with peptidoglycan-binding domain